MLNHLIEKFDLKAPAWDVASCFYDKDFDIESTYCAPFTIHHDGTATGKQLTGPYSS
jgi:hypothetical protein